MIRLNCDYLEGCHEAVLSALTRTNLEQNPGYGLDPHCFHAADLIRETFACPDSEVHFLVGGTQANLTVIAAGLRPYEGVLCAETGHINGHETGAVEATGHKIIGLPSEDGKLRPEQIHRFMLEQDDFEHTVRPGMVYISFPTEVGTIYTRDELYALHETCAKEGLILFLDGARLGYGLTAPANDVSPADLAKVADVFYIGGTKVGALFGEALVISNACLGPRFRYMIKQRGGMLAKGRLLGVQFEALMENGLYFEIARKATLQGLRIREALEAKGIPLRYDSPTNQQFAILTDAQAQALLDAGFVLENEGRVDSSHVCQRVCPSWATTDAQVDAFLQAVRAL